MDKNMKKTEGTEETTAPETETTDEETADDESAE